ncbi:NAD(P)-binding domain-containing protein [Rhodococcus sp. IEGM 1408]|uniref:NAD(P)-binding domain-containing protein n=1 Tax=Rhodococcus sp. IEGM 1408 TaxID=3082220 RepID=UPI002955CEAD|nr:NAD(P)-binding domain-containing protein [Rhodococcus sp. IEGM 1408]MDV8000838.1 NAD(P)-binding domain-containing protein [Rhodococcus sp. IEGM 1408]
MVVIGAGQAGLSAGYHLQRRGYVPVDEAGAGDRTFVVLDAAEGPGGAWRHRWESLTMATVNGIFGLPGAPVPAVDQARPSREVLPAYFADYERRFALDVRRPVRVRSVRRTPPGQAGSGDARLVVVATRGTDAEGWSAGHVINATGTWSRPFWPHYPGRESFRGRQLHVHDYVRAEEFTGQRVVIVGAGISATQLLDEISRVTETFWVTRREPEWQQAPASGHFVEAIASVEERTRQGLPPESIISVTGMLRGPWVERAEARGALIRHPMFTRIEPDGVRMPDGTLEAADVILWATGFRPAVSHLAPLGLRTPAGGIRVADGRALDEPRLFLIGYGPSQSTVGANRAGRDAVLAIVAESGRT